VGTGAVSAYGECSAVKRRRRRRGRGRWGHEDEDDDDEEEDLGDAVDGGSAAPVP